MGTAPTLRPRRRAAMVRRAVPQGKRARLELASCSLSLSAKMAFIGAWPSGKATGFGPVIPGSNPGAPAIVHPLMPTRLAAVVMAGGLGTRMRSALPKHLHPILGRRMVDWVLEAARPLDPSPLVVVASPDTASSFDGVDVAVQERPLGTGDAVRSAREALSGADDVLVLSGDTPLLTTELLEGLLGTHRDSGAV